jgi:hypothetical protein
MVWLVRDVQISTHSVLNVMEVFAMVVLLGMAWTVLASIASLVQRSTRIVLLVLRMCVLPVLLILDWTP